MPRTSVNEALKIVLLQRRNAVVQVLAWRVSGFVVFPTKTKSLS